MQENPDLFDEVERLRAKPVLKARETINKKMTESYSNAVDYLKRKQRKEFGDNVDLTTGGKMFDIPEEHKKAADKAIDDFLGK